MVINTIEFVCSNWYLRDILNICSFVLGDKTVRNKAFDAGNVFGETGSQ